MKSTQKLASFVKVETQPMNAEMWPVHALLWLAPELQPQRPRSSELRVERRHKPPMPDFLQADIAAAALEPTREHACEPIRPQLRCTVPESDLAPLGWDPRAMKGAAA